MHTYIHTAVETKRERKIIYYFKFNNINLFSYLLFHFSTLTHSLSLAIPISVVYCMGSLTLCPNFTLYVCKNLFFPFHFSILSLHCWFLQDLLWHIVKTFDWLIQVWSYIIISIREDASCWRILFYFIFSSHVCMFVSVE